MRIKVRTFVDVVTNNTIRVSIEGRTAVPLPDNHTFGHFLIQLDIIGTALGGIKIVSAHVLVACSTLIVQPCYSAPQNHRSFLFPASLSTHFSVAPRLAGLRLSRHHLHSRRRVGPSFSADHRPRRGTPWPASECTLLRTEIRRKEEC